jgi:four helix bundle protein
MAGDFTDLIAWQKAVDLAAAAGQVAERLRGPGSVTAADQLRRAGESVPANIAEGYGRGLGADFARFLRVAAGSAAEAESHLRVAVRAGRVAAAEADSAIGLAREVRALIRGLGRHVASRRPHPSSHTT